MINPIKYIFAAFLLLNVVACSQKKNYNNNQKLIIEKSIENITITKEYITGKFNPEDHENFIIIDSAYTDKKNVYMRKEAYSSFLRMAQAADKDGIRLIIRSATRNFYAQKGIWERKWKGETLLEGKIDASKQYVQPVDRARAILRYSSMPGTSRHHWGTDIDLNDFENEYFESGQGLRIYTWLVQNAKTFGYCQVYTQKNKTRPNGYEEEKWHWTYMPISKDLTSWAKANLDLQDISGFLGYESAEQLNVIEHYILGINLKCLPKN